MERYEDNYEFAEELCSIWLDCEEDINILAKYDVVASLITCLFEASDAFWINEIEMLVDDNTIDYCLTIDVDGGISIYDAGNVQYQPGEINYILSDMNSKYLKRYPDADFEEVFICDFNDCDSCDFAEKDEIAEPEIHTEWSKDKSGFTQSKFDPKTNSYSSRSFYSTDKDVVQKEFAKGFGEPSLDIDDEDIVNVIKAWKRISSLF